MEHDTDDLDPLMHMDKPAADVCQWIASFNVSSYYNLLQSSSLCTKLMIFSFNYNLNNKNKSNTWYHWYEISDDVVNAPSISRFSNKLEKLDLPFVIISKS